MTVVVVFAQLSVNYAEQLIEGLRDRTEYVPQLWNWENHS